MIETNVKPRVYCVMEFTNSDTNFFFIFVGKQIKVDLLTFICLKKSHRKY